MHSSTSPQQQVNNIKATGAPTRPFVPQHHRRKKPVNFLAKNSRGGKMVK
jgi:hypothetical protein